MSDITRVLETVFFTPWSNAFFAGNTLDYMALLLPAALGAAFAFRAGLCNMGLDGQIYAGSFIASIFLIKCAPFAASAGVGAIFFLTVAAAAAMLTGGLMALFCAILKNKTGANELITSFLLSAGLSPAIDYLVTGPLRDTNSSLLAMKPIESAFLLPHLLEPSKLSVSLPAALVFIFAAFLFFSKTSGGYKLGIMGKAPDFACFGGINVPGLRLPAFAFSGALGGLSGFFAVAGTYGMFHQSWTGGLGWAGITAALIARSKPLALIPASLFYAYLKGGADTALLISGASFESSYIIQALALFFVTVNWRRFFRGAKL